MEIRTRHDERFVTNVRAYTQFVSAHGRRPSRDTGDADERRLGKWLDTTRMKRDGLSPERIALLDQAIPDWRVTQRSDESFAANVRAYAKFVAARGRRPSGDTGDADERRLGIWIGTVRAKQGTLSPQRIALLDQAIPDWRVTRHSDEAFAANVSAYAKFVATHGRKPSRVTGDADERRIGKWLDTTRMKRDGLSPERIALLDQAIPDWRVTRQSDESFAVDVRSYAKFVSTHERRPSQVTGDADESRLGKWLADIRARRDNLSPERIALLDEAIPDWRVSQKSDESFEAHACAYAKFIVEHGRRPSTRSTCADERRAAKWMLTTRHRRAGLSAARVRLLDDVIPDWRRESEPTPFDVMVQQYLAFVSEHGRDPRESAKNADEARLARWWLAVRRRVSLSLQQQEVVGLIDAERQARLVSERANAIERFSGMAQRYRQFVVEHGRRPRWEKAEPGSDERSLAVWLKNTRSGRTSLSAEQREVMDRLLPWWSGDLAAADAWVAEVSGR